MSETATQLARAYRDDPELVEDLFIQDNGQPPNFLSVDQKRPELYALLAIAITDVVDFTVDTLSETYPPYGLITKGRVKAAEVENFDELQATMRLSLHTGTSLVVSNYLRDESPVYRRLQHLCDYTKQVISPDRYENPYVLIAAGANTAGIETARLLKAVSRVTRLHRPDASSAEIADVARNSERLALKMARMPLDYLADVKQIIDVSADPAHPEADDQLVWRQRANGMNYVDYRQPFSQMPSLSKALIDTIGEANRPTLLKHIGCPATIRLAEDQPLAVSRLWQWAIDIAEAENLFAGDDIYQFSNSDVAA